MPKEKFRAEDLLDCKLTVEELNEKGERLASLNQDAASLEGEAKTKASEFKAKINSCTAEITTLALIISKKSERRNVKCEIKFNTPIDGQKTFIRLDTGEIIRTCLMSDTEKRDIEINGMGDQELVFVFIDRREVPLIEQEACSQKDAAEWQTMGIPQKAESLIEAPLDPKASYRVIKGEDASSHDLMYQLQKRIEKEAKAKKSKTTQE